MVVCACKLTVRSDFSGAPSAGRVDGDSGVATTQAALFSQFIRQDAAKTPILGLDVLNNNVDMLWFFTEYPH